MSAPSQKIVGLIVAIIVLGGLSVLTWWGISMYEKNKPLSPTEVESALLAKPSTVPDLIRMLPQCAEIDDMLKHPTANTKSEVENWFRVLDKTRGANWDAGVTETRSGSFQRGGVERILSLSTRDMKHAIDDTPSIEFWLFLDKQGQILAWMRQ